MPCDHKSRAPRLGSQYFVLVPEMLRITLGLTNGKRGATRHRASIVEWLKTWVFMKVPPTPPTDCLLHVRSQRLALSHIKIYGCISQLSSEICLHGAWLRCCRPMPAHLLIQNSDLSSLSKCRLHVQHVCTRSCLQERPGEYGWDPWGTVTMKILTYRRVAFFLQYLIWHRSDI
eukprot:COSAG01_NODE_6871_length_3463_cov_17.354637_5_plen_174_part_00